MLYNKVIFNNEVENIMKIPSSLELYQRKLQKKSSSKEQISVLDFFKITYQIALIFGISISLLYFCFIVEAFPNIKEISQIISYLIAISGVTLVYILFFSILMIIPSSILAVESKKMPSLNNYDLSVFFSFPFISHIITNLILIFSSKIPIIEQHWILLFFIEISILILVLRYFYKKGYRDSLSLYLAYWFVTFIFILYFFISIYNTEGFDFFIQVCVICLISLVIVCINIYAHTKNKLLLNNAFKTTLLAKYIITISFSFVLITSIGSLLTNSQNPIFVKPFSILKIGSYVAKFDFKKDFSSPKNLFPLNDTNQTSNIFLVLSSTGDEYILKERYPLKLINNAINKNIDINITRYIEKNFMLKHLGEGDINKIYWFSNDLCWDTHQHLGNLNYTVDCPKNFSTIHQEMINDPILISQLKEEQIIPKDEEYPLKIKIDNELFIQITKHDGRIYWFTKNFCWENYEDIGNLDKVSLKCPSKHALKTSQNQNTNINYQIFKIKKSDANEIIGEAFKNIPTVWVINPK